MASDDSKRGSLAVSILEDAWNELQKLHKDIPNVVILENISMGIFLIPPGGQKEIRKPK